MGSLQAYEEKKKRRQNTTDQQLLKTEVKDKIESQGNNISQFSRGRGHDRGRGRGGGQGRGAVVDEVGVLTITSTISTTIR